MFKYSQYVMSTFDETHVMLLPNLTDKKSFKAIYNTLRAADLENKLPFKLLVAEHKITFGLLLALFSLNKSAAEIPTVEEVCMIAEWQKVFSQERPNSAHP